MISLEPNHHVFFSAANKKITPLKKPTYQQGFTIVELLIVIVVVGVLAAITIVGYNGIQDRAIASALKSDLNQAATKLDIDKTLTDSYPLDETEANEGHGLPKSKNTIYTYISDGSSFCLSAKSHREAAGIYKVTSADKSVKEGDCSYAVGDTGPAGGVIFYDKGSFSDGWRYLEAAPTKAASSRYEWGCRDKLVGATDWTIGAGRKNTAMILEADCEPEDKSWSTLTAAEVASNYSLNGYSDWFLPSSSEMSELYKRGNEIGLRGVTFGFYGWTSTEASAPHSYQFNSSWGYPSLYSKTGKEDVWPIRSF